MTCSTTEQTVQQLKKNTVILSNYKVAIQAIVTTKKPSEIKEIQCKIKALIYNKQIILQWILAYTGIA